MICGAGSVNGEYDDWGPNYNATAWGDNGVNCLQINAAIGSGNINDPGYQTAADGMSCYQEANNEQTARSMHVDGVHVCMADGSCRWINDFIQVLGSYTIPGDSSTSYTPPYKAVFSVWDRLIASGDAQQIPADAY